jgi:HD-like signal output (HDOD) protein
MLQPVPCQQQPVPYQTKVFYLRFSQMLSITLVVNDMKAARPPTDDGTLSPEQIVRDVKHLPSSPKVLPKLKRLLLDGDSSMHEIVQLIRFDAAIAARVLRVGNSAYYNQGLRCQTVDEAVNRVGYDLIYELVSYAVASQVLVRPLEVYSVEADELWQQSVACALAAERIAMITGDDGNVAYTVGLLHRIGMVVINEWALRERPELRMLGEGFPGEFIRSERAILGFTQADVGAELLRSWEFPPDMTVPVQCQYAPSSTAAAVRMASILFAARWIRAFVCDEPGRSVLPDNSLLGPLGLTPMRLTAVAREVRAQLQTISTLLVDGSPSPARSLAAG